MSEMFLDEVRKILNMTSTTELTDAVCLQSIHSAVVIVDVVKKSTNSPLIDEAIIRVAAYLAYQSWCDHPTQDPPGSYDEETGEFQPIDPVLLTRDQALKLNELRKTKDELLALIANPQNLKGRAVGMMAVGRTHRR
jgi:hypothetical protein